MFLSTSKVLCEKHLAINKKLLVEMSRVLGLQKAFGNVHSSWKRRVDQFSSCLISYVPSIWSIMFPFIA